MKTFICQICGDAYLGVEKPKNCPFCGARENFIKIGNEANPVVNRKIELNEQTIKNLKTTYDLEIRASALYTCMANKTKSYEIKAMYKRLAKVEMEHATIVTKILQSARPEIGKEICADKDQENFKRTILLEENATNLYKKFAKEVIEQPIKIMFTALSQVEEDHITLIKSYL